MTSLLVENIGRLLTMSATGNDERDGDERLGAIDDAFVRIADGRVTALGPQRDLAAITRGAVPTDEEPTRIDARGRLVTPGLVEPHAHPIFAGSRAREFDLRARGKSYVEIQEAGGGIRATVAATRAASDEELLALTLARLDRLLAHGVTVCEAKSGYALDVDGELRLLRVLSQVAARHPIDLSPTLLAHVPPPDAQHGAARERFIERFVAEAIPAARAERIAESIDVFCDRGAFTLAETRTLLEAGTAHGLALRVHAEQLSHTGAADLAAELCALSAEHLEQLAQSSIPRLAAAGTICTLLPGAALTLRLPFPSARPLLDVGCAVALGTDLNPGSSLTENLPLMMSIACMQMDMSCAEALYATTAVAARAALRPDAGRLALGTRGDLVIWDVDHEHELLQHYGGNHAETVIARGQVAWHRERVGV